MGDGLCIGGHLVMFFVCHVDVTRLERSQDVLYQSESIVRRPMLDQDLRKVSIILSLMIGERSYQWLALRRHSRAMQRMARKDMTIFW